MQPRLVSSAGDIQTCYEVISELRPHLAADEFVKRVQQQMSTGYQLAILEDGAQVVCAAGFRYGETLAWGKYLYVDDLVTLQAAQGRGFGRAMIEWLLAEAARNDCDQFHLDSGVQRAPAHKFYFENGLSVSSFHFVKKL